jgi:predicted aspartyl protease
MFDYQRENWNYAAPGCQIEVQNPSIPENKNNCMAFIDSGADMTCVPISIVSNLGLLSRSRVIMRQANGDTVPKDTFAINIRIGNYDFENIEVIPVYKQYVLIGRDIINQYKISLNAPSEIWGLNCEEICNYRHLPED